MTHQDQMDLPGSVPNAASEKDLPLLDDIRLLGRLLGDCVREQEGEDIFDIIENIRQTSIRFYRDDDGSAKRELENILKALDPEHAVQVVRAFSYFSHLANIAEDQHHIRRCAARGHHRQRAGTCRSGRNLRGGDPRVLQ
jgi:phosphoenolpyruvate carboxylase